MAVVKYVCGDCGGPLGRRDVLCPRCGARLEWVDTSSPRPLRQDDQLYCRRCGNLNAGSAAYCQSCGAALSADQPAGERTGKRGADIRGGRFARLRGKKFELWMGVAAVLLLAAIAVIVYTEASRDNRPGSRPTVAPSTPATVVPPGALEALQRAVDASPKDPPALLRLANALQDAGQYPRAIDVYGRYLTLKPKDPDARVDLGVCYYELAVRDSGNSFGLYASAVREMEAVMADVPTHQAAAFNLGVVNLHMGNMEASNKWFKRAVELGPTTDLGTKAKKLIEEHTFPQ